MHMGFNAAFAYGVDSGGSIATGAACAIRAVEAMSDVRIDAYLVVDFMGFVDVVDAVGGVDVTLLCPMQSRNAGGLDLPAGVSHLDGITAVNVARARTGAGVGDGSDLQRINRQHALFNAIMDKVYSMNYVTDFPKLYSLVSAVIGSVTTDIGRNLSDIAGFAYSLKSLNMSNVTFETIPVSDAGNGVNVVIRTSQAEPLWKALRNDRPLHELDPSATPSGSSADPEAIDPSETPTAPETSETPGSVPDSTPSGPPAPPTIQQPSDCDF